MSTNRRLPIFDGSLTVTWVVFLFYAMHRIRTATVHPIISSSEILWTVAIYSYSTMIRSHQYATQSELSAQHRHSYRTNCEEWIEQQVKLNRIVTKIRAGDESLGTVRIMQTYPTELSIGDFLRALNGCPFVQNLSFLGVRMRRRDAELLAMALNHQSTGIQTLSIRRLLPECLLPLCQSLAHNTTLRELCLILDSDVTEDALCCFADAIKTNDSLKKIENILGVLDSASYGPIIAGYTSISQAARVVFDSLWYHRNRESGRRGSITKYDEHPGFVRESIEGSYFTGSFAAL
jgi:hypothetical protein